MITYVGDVIAAPVEDVWPLLGDFTAWEKWTPLVVATTMDAGLDQGPVGSVRLVTSSAGSIVRERLVMKDDARHSLTYTFDGPSSLPVSRYVSTVSLFAITTSGATFVHWVADIDVNAGVDEQVVDAAISGFYLTFIDGLRTYLAA